MRFLSFIFLFFYLCLPSQAITWAQAQQSRDYLSAKKHLAEYLPELAIPKIKTLLALPKLDQIAKATLLTLLGEAQIRAALDQTEPEKSKTLTAALKTLDDKSLREFSPSHLWRSYALSNLGRLRDAIEELKKIDRRSMLDEANLQVASLMIAIGDSSGAKKKLLPLLKSEDPLLVKNATLHLISLALAEDQNEEGERLLATLNPSNPREEGLQTYLKGRLQLLRGERLEAGGTFENLLNTPNVTQLLPAQLFHETTLALADALALENNEEAGVTSLLQTLEKHPNSPQLQGIFARLKKWSPKIETASLISKLSAWVPTTDPKFQALPESNSAGSFGVTTNENDISFPPLSLYALEFIASTNLKSPDPNVRKKGMHQIEQLQLAGEIDTLLINHSLLNLGIARFKEKDYDRAITLFNLLTETDKSPLLKAYALALSGQASFAKGKPEDASEAFLKSAKNATRLHETSLRVLSELNAGISLLATTKSRDLDKLTGDLETLEAKSLLILERGLYLNTQKDPAARDLLKSFLNDFPNSPRKDEAFLALAESSIYSEPSDPILTEYIKKEILTLKFDFKTQATLKVRRILALLSLGIGQDQATDFVNKAPDHPLSPRILFQLGQTQRAVDDIGKAYVTFERFLTDYPDSEFTEAARYLNARTSESPGTESGQQNAIVRYRELIKGKGVLAHEAAISLSSLLIDREQYETALYEIITHLKNEKLNDSDRSRLLILGADASGQLGKHEDVLSFYANLLKIKNLPISTRNRASYQMGRTYERLDRKAAALESYLSVVNRDFDPTKTTNLEWTWFDKCGIEGALALLEREKRYRAAISLAEKLGKSGSPSAKKARESAERIGLEQRIWRDR